MSAPQRGRIVWVEILDPQSRNPKCRPAIILTPTEEIRVDGEVSLVAITSRLDAAPSEMQVELPWHAQGQTRTKLTKPSVAVCTWVFTTPVASIQSYGGIVPDGPLLRILEKVNALPPSPASVPLSEPPPGPNA